MPPFLQAEQTLGPQSLLTDWVFQSQHLGGLCWASCILWMLGQRFWKSNLAWHQKGWSWTTHCVSIFGLCCYLFILRSYFRVKATDGTFLLSKSWKKVGSREKDSKYMHSELVHSKEIKEWFSLCRYFLYSCNIFSIFTNICRIALIWFPSSIFGPSKLSVEINNIIHSFLHWQLKKLHSLHHACLEKQSHTFLCVERVITVKVKCMQFPNAKSYREKNTTLLWASQLSEAFSYDRP